MRRRVSIKKAKFAIDLSPLKKYSELRLIFASGLITRFGSAMTMVALPFQIKELTHSYLDVGIIGGAEIIPLIIFGLYGGVLADAIDRKKMMVLAEIGSLALSALLLGNSLLPHPQIWPLYLVAAGFAAFDGLASPSFGALIPRIVAHEDLPAAYAVMSLRWQFGAIAGPAISGLIITSFDVASGYAIDVISYLLSIAMLIRLANYLPTGQNRKVDFAALIAGMRYAVVRKDLLGTYLVDLSAMFFASPVALFPFWADSIHHRASLGLFYAAGTIGALLTTMTSGWSSRVFRHGRIVTAGALGWGLFIALAGASNSLNLILLGLLLAGAADQISAQFRGILWNQSISDEYRGRLAGIELLSYSLGPLGGQVRAGAMATWLGLQSSIIIGGISCILFIIFFYLRFSEFRKYDSRTNEFASANREKKLS
jgi:MFS family permease